MYAEHEALHKLDKWSNLLAIFMLEKPRFPNEVVEFRFPETRKLRKQKNAEYVYRNKSQYFHRRETGYLQILKNHGLLANKHYKSKNDPYDVNFEGLAKLLFISNAKNIDEARAEFASRLAKHRKFLFDFDSAYIFFRVGKEYKFPSIRGFINIAVVYSHIVEALLRSEKLYKNKTQMLSFLDRLTKESTFIANSRFLVMKAWKETTGLPEEEFYRRELEFILSQMTLFKKLYKAPASVYGDFAFYVDNFQGTVVHESGFYKPLTMGIMIPLAKKEIEKRDSYMFKTPFDFEHYKLWMQLEGHFR